MTNDMLMCPFHNFTNPFVIADICGRYFLRTDMEGSSLAAARKYDARISYAGSRMAKEHVASGFVFQKCQIGDIPHDDHTKSLHVALQRQNDIVHGEIDIAIVVRHELCHLSA